ncbi:MAG: hypothetical protein E6H07_09480 [Bacteroidetes bacterium]|nr:MAG: hypothetical protein E6H07_09480 [Bacteroidota bacterium]
MILPLRRSVYHPVLYSATASQFTLSLSKARTLVNSYCYSALGRSLLIATLLFCFFTNTINAADSFAEKIITVKVNSSGIVTIGRDTVSSDDIAAYIRDRLFKSYTGTGKMYDAIKLVIDGEPQAVVMEVVQKEIARGQKKALNELCIEKYKKLFEDISPRQQDKIKKNFKVLFQESYG